MSQVTSIATKKQILKKRSEIIRAVRAFFDTRQFIEITSPTLIAYPGQEPNLEPMRVLLQNEKKQNFSAYLHTSPEYTLKKCLAAGLERIYSLGPAYRNHESFGGLHNPEFTMLEWYRTNADFSSLMDDLDGIFNTVHSFSNNPLFAKPIERKHMRDVWQEYVGVNLDDYLTSEAMHALVISRGYTARRSDSYEALFYIVFLNEIEPHLGTSSPLILHHYPASMASLSKISDTDSRYAERFELYVGGVELANAFTELTESKEQRKRLVAEQEERVELGMSTYELDEDFLEAVEGLPDCAGIAFGVDRFIQLLLDCQNINDVLVLPCSKLFTSHE